MHRHFACNTNASVICEIKITYLFTYFRWSYRATHTGGFVFKFGISY